MSREYEVGDIVDITLRNAKVEHVLCDGRLVVQASDGRSWVSGNDDDVDITITAHSKEFVQVIGDREGMQWIETSPKSGLYHPENRLRAGHVCRTPDCGWSSKMIDKEYGPLDDLGCVSFGGK